MDDRKRSTSSGPTLLRTMSMKSTKDSNFGWASHWRDNRRFWSLLFCFLLAFDLFAAAKKQAKTKAPPKIPAGKPEIFQLEPRGIQRGVEAKIKLIGTNLIDLTELKLHNQNLKGEFLEVPPATTNEVWIKLVA